MNEKYFKKENEKELDYAMRLITIKKEQKPDDLDWADIVDLLGLDLNKDSLRKSQDTEFGGIAVYNKMKNLIIEKEPIDFQNSIQEELQELKKERMKIQDERAALNRKLRDKTREESLSEIAYKCANKIAESNPIDFSYKEPENISRDKAAILTLSDIHYGLVIDEFNNKYDPEICWSRMVKLAYKVLDILKFNMIDNLFILGLGDYLSGIIHTITRIENRENIIEQIMKFSELLCSFIRIIANENIDIVYYDVSDNHGRVFENKDISLNKDNFSLLIKWYLHARFENVENVNILDNKINESIGTVTIFDKHYCFVHGHRDKISNVVQNLSLMTKEFYEAIFIGHCHHFEANEVHGTYVYMNGTFAGTDEYANNLRTTSNPSQNLFIISKTNGIESQHLIRL